MSATCQSIAWETQSIALTTSSRRTVSSATLARPTATLVCVAHISSSVGYSGDPLDRAVTMTATASTLRVASMATAATIGLTIPTSSVRLCEYCVSVTT